MTGGEQSHGGCVQTEYLEMYCCSVCKAETVEQEEEMRLLQNENEVPRHSLVWTHSQGLRGLESYIHEKISSNSHTSWNVLIGEIPTSTFTVLLGLQHLAKYLPCSRWFTPSTFWIMWRFEIICVFWNTLIGTPEIFSTFCKVFLYEVKFTTKINLSKL